MVRLLVFGQFLCCKNQFHIESLWSSLFELNRKRKLSPFKNWSLQITNDRYIRSIGGKILFFLFCGSIEDFSLQTSSLNSHMSHCKLTGKVKNWRCSFTLSQKHTWSMEIDAQCQVDTIILPMETRTVKAQMPAVQAV